MPTSVRIARAVIGPTSTSRVGVLGVRKPVGARDGGRPGADQRDQASLHGALVELDGVADAEAPDHVEQPLEGDAFGVEQQLVAGVEDPQVAEHLPLGREERRVAAGAGGERLDVVADLALEERLRVRAGEGELAALGAVERAAGLGQRAVLGVARLDGAHADTG